MLDATGRVIYVGKAKQLRTRILSYFRAAPPEKAWRILQATDDIQWDYVASEFAALLRELREIKRHRPLYNSRMNRRRHVAFVKVSGKPAPKIYVGSHPGGHDVRHYGPFLQVGRLKESVKDLNDVLGLRDCALDMSIAFAEQRDLFEPERRAACIRHELGTCLGPCGGFVTEFDYHHKLDVAMSFLEGRGIDPLNQVIEAMAHASDSQHFEVATRWRARFDSLTWLLGACAKAHATLEALSFVYTDPGTHGDDRSYVVRRGTIRALAPTPRSPIERAAFRALVSEHLATAPEPGPVPTEAIDETLLVMSWFRQHPGALRRTEALADWLENHAD
jgi:excinuclease ABC subunit C